MTVYLAGAYLSAGFVIVPIVIGLKNIKTIPATLTLLFPLLFISLIVDIAGIILNERKINNMLLGYLYTAAEFFVLFTVYKRFLSINNIVYYSSLFVFFSFMSAEIIFNGIHEYNSISTSIEAISLMFCALATFYFIMKTMTLSENLLSEPLFYFNSGILIYFAGDLILFLLSSYLQKNKAKSFPELYLLHSILHILYSLLLTVTFTKTKRATQGQIKFAA